MQPHIKALLTELEKTRHIFWNISTETGIFLNQLIRTNNIKTILEIGTSNGVSAIWMTEALEQNAKAANLTTTTAKLAKNNASQSTTNPKQQSTTTHHLYTIESHKKLRFGLATENFAKAKLTNRITQILGHAPDVIPTKPKTFDLIFLDATKYEHPDYLKALLPRTKKGSIIITDNAISHKKELAPYLAAIKKLPNFETNLLPIGSGLLVSTRL